MSLDFYLEEVRPATVFSANITHNLNEMAEEAGLYHPLWRPDEIGVTKAAQLIGPLEDGLKCLLAEPERFKKLNPSNGWGSYDGLVKFAAKTLAACRENPDATVRVSR